MIGKEHNTAFRRVWLGATVSAAGDAACWVALIAYAMSTAHASVATLAVLYTAPVAIGGLVAGWALDRYDRRRLLIADSLARAAVFGTIPLAAALGGVSAAQLYAVAAAYGLLKMISLAGFPALIPQLVPPSQLMAANALESVSFGIAGLVGAVGAGLAVTAFARERPPEPTLRWARWAVRSRFVPGHALTTRAGPSRSWVQRMLHRSEAARLLFSATAAGTDGRCVTLAFR